ncbi:MAG: SagB/ThcOx family dehydrogenase [Candidatus Methanospirareceae archaeon]
MKKIHIIIMTMVLISAGMGGFFILRQPVGDSRSINERIKLPEPKYDSNTSVEEALRERRSIRAYKDEALTLTEVSQLLWAAQGITDPRGFRTAPSAGALYPLEVYVVIGNVEGVTEGVYKYKPHEHELLKVRSGDVRDGLSVAALGQSFVGEGSIVIVFSAVYERTTQRYGDRGIRYVHMEAGHAAQNVYLQAVSLNLGTVVVGAFKDDEVRRILNMPDEEHPLYIMPVGKI